MKGYEMIQQKVYIQRDWTDQELVADGFLSYRPVKHITMVRMLPPEEAPKTMKAAGNTITAEAGYWVAYVAGETLKATLDDYNPRPIEPVIFAETYRHWDEPNIELTPTETHLQELGCNTYYKTGSIWAKKLDTEIWVQGIESNKPTRTPSGMWLCVGMEGEPWSITDAWFQAHYLLPRQKNPGEN
jgi:hypothetical protein